MSIPGLFFGNNASNTASQQPPPNAGSGITPCLPCAPAHSCYRTKENVQYYMRRTKTNADDIEVQVTRKMTICDNATPRPACEVELEQFKQQYHFQ